MEPRDLIQQLLSAGFTQQRISVEVGVAQSTISKLLRGDVSDMLSRSYRRLVAFHAENMAKPAAAGDQSAEGERRAA